MVSKPSFAAIPAIVAIPAIHSIAAFVSSMAALGCGNLLAPAICGIYFSRLLEPPLLLA